MLKKSIIATAAALVLAAAVAPAFASTTNSVFGTSDYLQIDTAKAAIAQQLEQRGLKVDNVDEWGGFVRVDVIQPDGTQATQYFQPGSLAPVSLHDIN